MLVSTSDVGVLALIGIAQCLDDGVGDFRSPCRYHKALLSLVELVTG